MLIYFYFAVSGIYNQYAIHAPELKWDKVNFLIVQMGGRKCLLYSIINIGAAGVDMQ